MVKSRVEEDAPPAPSGTLYAKVGGSGAVFDISDLQHIEMVHLELYTLTGSAEPPTPVHGLFLATRPGQVFACHPSRTPAALLLAFDTEHVTNPSLTNVVEIPGTDDLGGREGRGIRFDTDGRLWITAYQRLIR